MEGECIWDVYTRWLDGKEEHCRVHGEIRIEEWDRVNVRTTITPRRPHPPPRPAEE